MAQFSVYKNNNRSTKTVYPYFVDIQNPLLNALETRLVIPLAPYKREENLTIKKLSPKVTVNGETLILKTYQMTAIPLGALATEVDSLEYLRDEIVAAIDFLVTGI